MKKLNSKSGMATGVAALGGTTGMVIAGAAVAGIAGYLLWRNRETVFNFVGQYVDLPEALDFSEDEDKESEIKSSSIHSPKLESSRPSPTL